VRAALPNLLPLSSQAVADDINNLADTNNDTTMRNHDFPALWQKRALENAAPLERARLSAGRTVIPPDEAAWPGRVVEASNGSHETTERTAILNVRSDPPWAAASAGQTEVDHHV
jgi:hypothetical protein